MAIAYDNQTGNNGTATSLTVSHTASGSDRIAVTGVVGENSSDVITGSTYGGAAMTLWDKIQVPGWRWVYLYYILNPATDAQATAAMKDYLARGLHLTHGQFGFPTYGGLGAPWGQSEAIDRMLAAVGHVKPGA